MKGHLEDTELALLAGDEVDPGRVAGYGPHLSGCPVCAAKLEQYRRDRQALAAMREAGVAAVDFDVMRQKVLDHLQTAASRRFRFGPAQWGALAAVILTALALGFWRLQVAPVPQEPRVSEKVAGGQNDRLAERPEVRADPAASRVANRSKGQHLAQAAPVAERKPVLDRDPHKVEVASIPSVPASFPAVPDDVVMKLQTSDPDITIIWLASPKGAGR